LVRDPAESFWEGEKPQIVSVSLVVAAVHSYRLVSNLSLFIGM
jgi:hypothetical protein